MNATWTKVRLGDLLRRSPETITISPDKDYQEVTLRLWGKGVVLRGVVSGAAIAGSRRFVAKAGQFILSRIDARNGAIGVVPAQLDGAVVTNDFPLFDFDTNKLDVTFLGWLSRTNDFVELCKRASEGTTNRVRLQEERFLALEIALPPLAEQRRIVARIEELAAKIAEARSLRQTIRVDESQMLLAAFNRIAADAPRRPMKEIAPLVRRPIEVDAGALYAELGIRSFGKGTFHKPLLPGISVGSKRLFEILPGDLVFNNVFAWEGAVAVVRGEDAGTCGSHRFITCRAQHGVTTAQFLCFYFLTEHGLDQLREASPGGAGRNRTLGLETLGRIEVPIPEFKKQVWFDDLQAKVDALKRLQTETAAELDALLPAILDRAFKGEL